ncbi:flagellin, partial [Candidatus Darwinibacter acetoxidans]
AKQARATFTVGSVPNNGDTIMIAGKVIGFSADGSEVDGADFTINLDTGQPGELNADGVAAAIAGLTIDGVTMSASGADVTVTAAAAGAAGNSIEIDAFGTTEFTGGADEVPAGLSATINGEAVLQTVASGAGEITYTTASGKSVTADLGTFDLDDESVDIVFNVTVEDVPDDEKGLQVGQLKVENVTKDSVGGIMTQAGADKAITVINDAIEAVSAERSKLGAYQNRLEHTISNLGTSAENLQAAESRIRDLDMAEEIMAFTKNNILQQAATAMLAQANMAPQSVLQLLG